MRKGRVAALAGILAAAVGMGLFFPDLVVNVADQKMEDQEEHFSVDTTASFADGRLTDMMRLAMSYVDEIYLYSGVEQSEGDVASIAGNIAAKLSEDGILPQMTYGDAETEAFVAVGEEQEVPRTEAEAEALAEQQLAELEQTQLGQAEVLERVLTGTVDGNVFLLRGHYLVLEDAALERQFEVNQ